MTDVDKVALWVSLISSVVSIVLSVVATVFAILVNNRSEKVSDQTIKSLQKIESAVERLSSDTSGLIKAAWDTMLGSVSGNTSRDQVGSSSAAHKIASGLATEMRSDLGLADKEPNKTADPNFAELSEKIDKAIEKFQDTVEGQLKALNRKDGPAAVFDKVSVLDRLSLPAQELAKTIRRAHLTRKHYDAIQKGPLGSALRELREAGLLVPLTGKEDGKKTPVYYFPPGQTKTLRSALLLMPSPPSSD